VRPVYLCIGIPGAGTTWLFNVMREILLRDFDAAMITAIYSDSRPEPDPVKVILAKSHIPDSSIADAVRAGAVPAVLAVRDPRDCVVSCMERFGYGFETAVESVRDSAAAIERLMQRTGQGPRIYEADLFSPGTVTLAARALGAQLAPDAARELLDRWAPEAVSQFVVERAAKREMIANSGTEGDYYDAETHWHLNHAGRTGESGRWTSALSAEQQALVTTLFERPYKRWLGAHMARASH
jgi:hypothetical protein